MSLKGFLKYKWNEFLGNSPAIQQACNPVSKVVADGKTFVPVETAEIFGLQENDLLEFEYDEGTHSILITPFRAYPVTPAARVASETAEDDVEFEEVALVRLRPPVASPG